MFFSGTDIRFRFPRTELFKNVRTCHMQARHSPLQLATSVELELLLSACHFFNELVSLRKK